MTTTQLNTKNVNRVEPPKVKIVNVLPKLKDAELGEMFLLMSDGDGDTNKIHVRVANGWLKVTLS